MSELAKAIGRYLSRVASYDPLVVVVELLLIGAVVWIITRFLRGTRGVSLVKGAAVLLTVVYLGIQLLPREHGWVRINFLYGKFLLFAFVVVVVAFQPELRRGLSQLGRTRMFGGQRRYVGEEIDQIVESVSYLSRNKIGAILAVERRVGLGGWLESGTPIDAEISSTLLNALFFPNSPLHDMGVIVQSGRIAAAGCQFPLAESEDMDVSFGSRHRAALGLAQETDAVVVVVSEETGRVSVACEGQMHVGLEIDALRELLLATLAPAGRKSRWSFPLARRGGPRP
jgi:diadenylate cyclase